MVYETARLGGMRVLSLEWISSTAVLVRFVSLNAGWIHHLYAGREFIGKTSSPADRRLTARLVPSEWPQALTLVAVDPSEANTDFGDALPRMALNRAHVTFKTSGWTDGKFIDLYSAAAPEGVVDETNRLARILFGVNGSYEATTAPLPGSGWWPIRVRGMDDKPDAGNQGTNAETVVRTLSHPPDLIGDPRFNVAVASGVATITCEIP